MVSKATWTKCGVARGFHWSRLHKGFVAETIRFIAAARQSKLPEPAHDSWRFPGERPHGYDSKTTYSVLRFLEDHAEEINRSAALLADDASRQVLKQLFAYRALGPRHVMPPIDVDLISEYYKNARELIVGPSSARMEPYEVACYRVRFKSVIVDIECWLGSLVATFFGRQYYFEKGPISICPRRGDIVIDAGACFGDTVLAFAISVGSAGVVHSFEPIPAQREFYERNQSRNPAIGQIMRLHECALTNISDAVLQFANYGAGSRIAENGSITKVKTITIDDFVDRLALPRVDFIKMDIEGAEEKALAGAKTSIRRFRPQLAISAYHSINDLVSLTGQIMEIEPSYRLYLAHHSMHSEETVLYGFAE